MKYIIEINEFQRNLIVDCINEKICNVENVLDLSVNDSFFDKKHLKKFIDKLYSTMEIFGVKKIVANK